MALRPVGTASLVNGDEERDMGNGYFDGQRLHFVATAVFDLLPGSPDEVAWRTVLENTSADLYRATLGQVQFGTVYLADNGVALPDADMLLVEQPAPAESSASVGGFGRPGHAVSLVGDAFSRLHLPVHELAHHLWGLGDEYTAGADRILTVNRTASVPGLRTIEVTDALVPNELVGALLYLTFASNVLGRGRVTSNTANRILLDVDLPHPPSAAVDDRGVVQPVGSCARPRVTGAPVCLMEEVDHPPVTGFCDTASHVGTTDNEQEHDHGESCWNTIVATPGFDHLLLPPGPSPLPPADPLTVVRLVDAARFALAVDVSGSMSGDKLRYAKAGITYWLETLTVTGDRLAVLAFRGTPTAVLPLTAVDANLDMAAVTAAIDGLAAAGPTNIRDAIGAGITQITSVPDVAALQAVVLLTDGKHNRPAGSSVVEVQGDLHAQHVKLAAIGLGPVDDLDTEELAGMAAVTNGFSTFVETEDGDLLDVESAMIDAHLRLLGDLFELVTDDVVPPPPAALQHVLPVLESLLDQDPDVSLAATLDAVGVDLRSVLRPAALAEAGLAEILRVHPFVVEDGCESINASINFPYDQRFHLWLLGPRLREAGGTDPNVTAGGSGSHRFRTVTDPAPGRWRAVVLRRPADAPGKDRAAATCRLAVGGRHRAVGVVARTVKAVFTVGEQVTIEGRVRWGAPLTGVSVDALVRGPGGLRRRVRLRDGAAPAPDAGDYRGGFHPEKPGRHHALVRFTGNGRAVRADGAHLLTHTPPDGPLDLTARAGRFRRVVPLTFDVLPDRR